MLALASFGAPPTGLQPADEAAQTYSLYHDGKRGRMTDSCKYTPSDIEKAWMSNGNVKGRVCEIAAQAEQVKAARLWMAYAKEQDQRKPTKEEQAVLSRFDCEHGDKKWVEWIEPLTGVAGHPFGVPCSSFITDRPAGDFNLDYLVPTSGCSHGTAAQLDKGSAGKQMNPYKSVFFDLNCGDFDRKQKFTSTTEGSSLPFFDDLYSNNCHPLSELYAYEPESIDPTAFWAKVPVADRVRMHWINTAAMEDPTKRHVAFSDTLKAAVSPADFVAVKGLLQPDSALAVALSEDPEVTKLVDEIYLGGNMVSTSAIDSALKRLSNMRHKGIRSHFWL